jgi:REP element-mobilizing transposase RayT
MPPERNTGLHANNILTISGSSAYQIAVSLGVASRDLAKDATEVSAANFTDIAGREPLARHFPNHRVEKSAGHAWPSLVGCDMLAEQLRKFSVEVWAYCLMPNHVHLILTPQGADGMSRALGEAHRRYTNFINARGRWTGHLYQSRFASVAMGESHLRSAVSYVSLNPVRARLVSRAEIENSNSTPRSTLVHRFSVSVSEKTQISCAFAANHLPYSPALPR